MKILHIDSSVLGGASASRRLSAAIVQTLLATNPEADIVYRDLAAAPPSHLEGTVLQAMFSPTLEGLSETQLAERIFTDTLLAEFLGADVVVVGAPMYNYAIPTQLKAWIDRIAQAGKTFKYSANGPVGLAGGKRLLIASSRGGVYTSSEAMQALDHQEAYLRAIFGFFGITDVAVIRAEGLALGEAARVAAFVQAEAEIAGLQLSEAA